MGEVAEALSVQMLSATDMTEALRLMRTSVFDLFVFNCEVRRHSVVLDTAGSSTTPYRLSA